MSEPTSTMFDLDAERSVLGGILLVSDALGDVVDIVSPDDFSVKAHSAIFAAMVRLGARGVPLDIITLADDMRKAGTLDGAGGNAYLGGLDAYVPATANLARYARIVLEKAVRRRLIAAAVEVIGMAKDHEGELSDVLDRAEKAIFAVGRSRLHDEQVVTIGATVQEVYAEILKRAEMGVTLTGTSTGFDALDTATTGLHGGELVVVAGRPSMGKSAFAMNMALKVATGEKQKPVAVFSLEMKKDRLVERILAAEGGIAIRNVQTGSLAPLDWSKLARACDVAFKAPVVINDLNTMTINDIRTNARRIKAKLGGLGLVVVDYLQLISGPSTGRWGEDNREQIVADISRGLKRLAGELDVPVIALSQLNRGLERRDNKRPMMSDLRESGAIEQDADTILFLYRDEVYNKASPDKGTAEVIIAKQRNGPTQTVRVGFENVYVRFNSLPPDESDPSLPLPGSWG